MIQILLNKGAEVNTQNGIYGNALQAASEGGHEKIVQILLDKGADVNAQGGWYGTALKAAIRHGHAKVQQILLEKGAKRYVLAPFEQDSGDFLERFPKFARTKTI